MHESEVAFQAVVDPYARADFFISFGEEGVNLEEGFITFTALPGGLLTKVGKMRAAFGKVNTLHNHVLPWTDRPLVIAEPGRRRGRHRRRGHLGGAADSEPVDLSRGDRPGVSAATPARSDGTPLFKSTKRSELSYVGHLRGYQDLTEQREHRSRLLVLARPQRPERRQRRRSRVAGHTQLYGIDATYRWKPLQRSIYHSFVGRTEVDLEPARSAGRPAERDRVSTCPATISSRGAGSPASASTARRTADDASLHRYRRVAHRHLLAERVQPGARRSTAAPTTRDGPIGATSCCSSSSSRSARTARIRSRVQSSDVRIQSSYDRTPRDHVHRPAR